MHPFQYTHRTEPLLGSDAPGGMAQRLSAGTNHPQLVDRTDSEGAPSAPNNFNRLTVSFVELYPIILLFPFPLLFLFILPLSFPFPFL